MAPESVKGCSFHSAIRDILFAFGSLGAKSGGTNVEAGLSGVTKCWSFFKLLSSARALYSAASVSFSRCSRLPRQPVGIPLKDIRIKISNDEARHFTHLLLLSLYLHSSLATWHCSHDGLTLNQLICFSALIARAYNFRSHCQQISLGDDQSRLGVGMDYFAFLPFAGLTRTPLIFHHVLINRQCLASILPHERKPWKPQVQCQRCYDLLRGLPPGNVSRMSLYGTDTVQTSGVVRRNDDY